MWSQVLARRNQVAGPSVGNHAQAPAQPTPGSTHNGAPTGPGSAAQQLGNIPAQVHRPLPVRAVLLQPRAAIVHHAAPVLLDQCVARQQLLWRVGRLVGGLVGGWVGGWQWSPAFTPGVSVATMPASVDPTCCTAAAESRTTAPASSPCMRWCSQDHWSRPISAPCRAGTEGGERHGGGMC